METLGYRGHPDWRDMSEYAVHFTKGTPTTSPYDTIMDILFQGKIDPSGPYGAARKKPALGASQKSACFSEIPLDLLDRLVKRRRSLYGIGFSKEILINAGGAPVWYMEKDSVPQRALFEIIESRFVGAVDPGDPLWKVTPFIDFPGIYRGIPFHFEWEREWRVPGGLEISPREVAFLFIPEEEHSAARAFFKDAENDGNGPSYDCPFVDPRWGSEEIQRAFSAIPKAPPLPDTLADAEECQRCGGDAVGGWCFVCGNPAT